MPLWKKDIERVGMSELLANNTVKKYITELLMPQENQSYEITECALCSRRQQQVLLVSKW